MFQDFIRILMNPRVPYPNDAISEGFQDRGSFSVLLLPSFHLMRKAVHFDDQRKFSANEIGDIAIDRNLPTKFESVQIPVPQQSPELFFCWNLLAAHLSGEFQQSGINSKGTSFHGPHH